jgi:hypothetical protein
MKLDEYEFEKTAQALMIMNPSCIDQYDDWMHLESFMISMAYTYSHESSSFSTGGFVLTAYDGSDGERHVRASVSAHVASLYVTKTIKVDQVLSEIISQIDQGGDSGKVYGRDACIQEARKLCRQNNG